MKERKQKLSANSSTQRKKKRFWKLKYKLEASVFDNSNNYSSDG